MNKQQKEVLTHQLSEEQKQLKWLQGVYQKAAEDTAEKIAALSARTDMENLQSIIYQKKYQEALKEQIDEVLGDLQTTTYKGISDYLKTCYEDGYVGAMYDIALQGIPIVAPIDPGDVAKALKIDSKLSKGLYTKLGVDVNHLKKAVRSEVSRGIASAKTWNEVANNLAKHMEHTPFSKAKSNAMRIARTEGHRVQIQSTVDAQKQAKAKGADVVKQWDATLDGATRDTHRELDGKIAEIEDDFEYSGGTVSAPGMFGDPAEDCNCRCALLQRARWALDEGELQTLQESAEYWGLDKTEDFEDYKEKYLGISDESVEKDSNDDTIEEKRGQIDTGYSGKIPDDKLDEYNEKALKQIITDTGYPEDKAKKLHGSLLEYFGGDYGSILTGNNETAKIIAEGIARMPKYDGSIYRGLIFDDDGIKQFSELKVGDALPRKGIIESWSSNSRVSQSFGGANDYYRNTVILECENNISGVGVQHISKFGAREAEVLTSTKYKVIEVTKESKYDYLSRHKDLLYFEEDLEEERQILKEMIVCRIKVKEIR